MRSVSLVALVLALIAATAYSGPGISAEPITVPACPKVGVIPAGFMNAATASSFRASDGREVRLAGVIGPGEDGEAASPQRIAAARAALESMLSGRHLSLAAIGLPDRYQRVTAQVFADGVWVQDAMLRHGLLRVAPGRLPGACLAFMLAAEDSAISAKDGHWGDGSYRIRTPDQVTKSAGRFETVEGEIWRTRLVKGRETIEFTNASSFQLDVPPQAARSLRNRGIDIRRLRGATVRVRGWIGFDDKPAMEVSTPEALEMISKAARRR